MKTEDVVGKGPVETSEITGDTWAISLPKTRIHTLPQLLDYCKVDESVWAVEKFQVNKWEVGIKVGKGDNAKVKTEPLFQVKAFLKKKVEVENIKKEIESLKKLAVEFPWPQELLRERPRKPS